MLCFVWTNCIFVERIYFELYCIYALRALSVSLRGRETEKKPVAVETHEALSVDPGTECQTSLVASDGQQVQPSWAAEV